MRLALSLLLFVVLPVCPVFEGVPRLLRVFTGRISARAKAFVVVNAIDRKQARQAPGPSQHVLEDEVRRD
jgi:hypothetical protein